MVSLLTEYNLLLFEFIAQVFSRLRRDPILQRRKIGEKVAGASPLDPVIQKSLYEYIFLLVGKIHLMPRSVDFVPCKTEW